MLHLVPAPADTAAWLHGGVLVRLGPQVACTRFPALPHAMLTLRLRPAAAGAGHWPDGEAQFHTLSTGPSQHPHPPGQAVHALGWLVRPEAAAELLGASTGALVDRVLPWREVAGAAEAERLLHDAAAARTDAQRLHALRLSLQRALARAQDPAGRGAAPGARGRLARWPAWCAALGAQGAQAAAQLGVGPRQLERHCKALLGVSPKQFQRLVRGHQALSMALRPGAPAAAELALAAGYFDQSHLGLELRRLAGAPLGVLRAQALADAPWWPLASARLRHHR